MTKYLLFFLVDLILIGCSPKYPVTIVEPSGHNPTNEYDGTVFSFNGDDSLTIEVAYIAEALNYVIFEVKATNSSYKTLTLNHLDFKIQLHHDEQVGRVDEFTSISPTNHIKYLISLQDEEHRNGRHNRTMTGILAGLEVVAAVLTPGAGVNTGAIIASDRTAQILTDKKYTDRAIESIDNEIIYLSEQVLNEELVQPGQHICRDVLFENLPFSGTIILTANINSQTYTFSFRRRVEMR